MRKHHSLCYFLKQFIFYFLITVYQEVQYHFLCRIDHCCILDLKLIFEK